MMLTVIKDTNWRTVWIYLPQLLHINIISYRSYMGVISKNDMI